MTDPREKVVVLVADDEPSTLALVSSHVRSRGYKVLEASDGDQAWQLAYENLPDLVILDVMMPGMSGWEVCRKIREVVSLAHTGVIMLTGIGENLNEMTSPLYGADEYIDKPFEFADLDKKIERTLDERSHGEVGRPDDVETSARDMEPEAERAHGDGSNGAVKVSRTRARKAASTPVADDMASGDEPDPVTRRREPSPERLKAKPKAKAKAAKKAAAKPAPAKAKAARKKASGKKPAAMKAGAKAAMKSAPVKAKAAPKKAAGKAKAAPKKAAKPAKTAAKATAKSAAKGGKGAAAKSVAKAGKAASKATKATAKAAPAKSAAKTSKPARGSRSSKIQSDGPPAG